MAIRYTKREEQWNTWSHAAGIALGAILGTVLIILAVPRGAWADVGVALYLFGMLASYAASTIYHALPAKSRWKERLRRWDHAAIYWHIAGSYSPITLVAMRGEGWWGYGLFAFIKSAMEAFFFSKDAHASDNWLVVVGKYFSHKF